MITTCFREINLSEMHMRGWTKKSWGIVCPVPSLVTVNNVSTKGYDFQ